MVWGGGLNERRRDVKKVCLVTEEEEGPQSQSIAAGERKKKSGEAPEKTDHRGLKAAEIAAGEGPCEKYNVCSASE